MEHLYKIRKDLHRIPEIAYREYKTHEYIYNYISRLEGIKIYTFDVPGMLVEYIGGKDQSDDYILFRAEMDALPVEELTGCDFTSTHKGVMHACGHDIHLAVLIGLLDFVTENKVKKNVLFLFQPAEEGQGGAQRVIASGIFDKYAIKEAYALHVKPDLPLGTISSCPGVIFGIPQEFDVLFKGKSSHAANPHKGRDAIMAASLFITNTNSIIAKSFSPSKSRLFHIGKISGGSIRNVVADQCRVEGTLRVIEEMEPLKDIIVRSARAAALSFDVEAGVDFLGTYDPVINSEKLFRKLRACLPANVSLSKAEPALTGEDFGFFTTRYDGLLFWLGVGECEYDLHSPYFLPDERAILTGLQVYKNILHSDL